MRIIGLPKLEKFKKEHGDIRGSLDSWQAEIERARWRTTQNIKDRYPNADFLAGNKVIFNIKGNNYRLIVKVNYQSGIVMIDWIGTHSQYDKLNLNSKK